MRAKVFEVNCDGLVGPTHNYTSLSQGPLVRGHSAAHSPSQEISKPREAALQGLYKMKMLSDLGLKQIVLPPQERPDIFALVGLGFSGDEEEILHQALKHDPALLAACSSASSMWAANAAHVTPSSDTCDGKVHFTPANLQHLYHRSLETQTTAMILQGCFANPDYFVHHDPLPCHPLFSDEGAANHMRFCIDYGEPGVHLFVYGHHGKTKLLAAPHKFPSRQSYEACHSIARLHSIPEEETVFAQQHPEALDAGVIHNDIICAGNKLVFMYHEKAFVNAEKVVEELQQKALNTCRKELCVIKVTEAQLPLKEAVSTYFFNSQLISLPGEKMALVAPVECRDHPQVKPLLEAIIVDKNPIEKALYFNLRQSMQNGGGPACLRLRVVLTREEIAATNPYVFLNESLYKNLVDWVNEHYREELHFKDLADPMLLVEVRHALDKLTELMDLGPLYRFQQ